MTYNNKEYCHRYYLKHRQEILTDRKLHNAERREKRRLTRLCIAPGVEITVQKRLFEGHCELCGKQILKRPEWHHWNDKHPEIGLWTCLRCHQVCESWESSHKDLVIKYLELKKVLEGEE